MKTKTKTFQKTQPVATIFGKLEINSVFKFGDNICVKTGAIDAVTKRRREIIIDYGTPVVKIGVVV